jgi:hypothetical protein
MHDFSVLGRPWTVGLRAPSRHLASDVAVILDRHRHAEQRLGIVCLGRRVDPSRGGDRGVREHHAKRVDVTVHALDLAQHGAHQLLRGDNTVTHQPRLLERTGETDLIVAHQRRLLRSGAAHLVRSRSVVIDGEVVWGDGALDFSALLRRKTATRKPRRLAEEEPASFVMFGVLADGADLRSSELMPPAGERRYRCAVFATGSRSTTAARAFAAGGDHRHDHLGVRRCHLFECFLRVGAARARGPSTRDASHTAEV